MQKMIVVAGDVAPVPQATLTDVIGNPLNLYGANVRFRMVNRFSNLVAVDAPAVVLQDNNNPATFGQVAYYWQPNDTVSPGLYLAWFITNFGNGPEHFPPDESYFILIKPSR